MADIENMTGQWVGISQPDGEQPTTIVVNIEGRAPTYAQLIGINPTYGLRTLSDAEISTSGASFTGKTFGYRVLDASKDRFVPLAEFHREQGKQNKLPTQATYSGRIEGRKISGEFKNDLEQAGKFVLWRSFSEALTGDHLAPVAPIGPLTWDQFKAHVAKFRSRDKTLFRGQNSNQHRLRTSFHRAGRNNLLRYLDEDIFRLRHQINAISHHYYHQQGEDLLGLLSLAQHHGFPTPLLDWTESPYVAAFFAFDCLTDRSKWDAGRSPVRIYTFDWAKWRTIERQQAGSLHDPWPDFQLFHPPAHNNPRYYPQQSVAAFANIDDIEDFIASVEKKNGVQCLTRIDIRSDQRELVEDELRFMGITAATLFPGLEGACKSLRSELF